MFQIALALTVTWMVVFVASAGFDLWYEMYRPKFLYDTLPGRVLAVLGISPLIATFGVAVLASYPWAIFSALLAEEDLAEAWDNNNAALFEVVDWFRSWAPSYITSGKA